MSRSYREDPYVRFLFAGSRVAAVLSKIAKDQRVARTTISRERSFWFRDRFESPISRVFASKDEWRSAVIGESESISACHWARSRGVSFAKINGHVFAGRTGVWLVCGAGHNEMRAIIREVASYQFHRNTLRVTRERGRSDGGPSFPSSREARRWLT